MFAVMKAVVKNYSIPICLVLINIFIKSLYLVSESISHDEPFTIYHAQFNFSQLIHYLKNYNNPPLYEIILHFWIKGFGISELSVRILPMLFSSFAVFFIYQIGKDFFDKNVAVISGLLFTFSTMQIWYAHDCRVYSLFVLLTSISFYLFFKLLKEEKLSKLNLIFIIAVNALMIYAHYFGAFVWLIEALIVAIYHLKNKKIIVCFIKIILFSIVLYVPQIITLYQRFFESAKNGTWLEAPAGLESLYNMIWSFSNQPVVAVLSLVLFTACLIKFFVFTERRIQNPFVKYCIIWFVFPLLFMFFVSYKIPMFLDRYLIFITPAFYLLLARTLSFLFQKKTLYYISVFILTGAFIFSSSLNPSKKRLVKETVDFIKSNKDPETIVLVCSPEFMTNFAYYYNPDYFKEMDRDKEYETLFNLLKQDHIYFIDRVDSFIVGRINSFNKIIYMDAGADASIPGNAIKQDLTRNYKLQKVEFYPERFHIYLFNRN